MQSKQRNPVQHVASYDETLAGSINLMLRERVKPDKALDAQLGQASWSLSGLMVGDNMLYFLCVEVIECTIVAPY
jgi:hypothetical protein